LAKKGGIDMTSILIITTLVLFFIAAIFEIGGGYLVWKWLKEKRNWIYGLFGGLVLFGYGIILTLQPSNFSRVYAAYGGIFIISSIIWGYVIDKKRPDKIEIIGALIALMGALIIFYAPR
jgi:small multidrug resistance family-3 protein